MVETFPTEQYRARVKEGEDSDAPLADIRSFALLRLHELVPGRSRQALCASITAESATKCYPPKNTPTAMTDL